MKIYNWIKLIAFSLIIYSAFIILIGASEFKQSILLIPLSLTIGAIFFPLASHFILSIRWHYFIKYLHHKIMYTDGLKIYLAGLSLMASPARSGEAIRALWLTSRHSIPINVGVSVTISERIGDLLSALILIAISIDNFPIITFLIILLFTYFYLPSFINPKTIQLLKKIIQLMPLFIQKFIKKRVINEASIVFKQTLQLIKPLPLLISVLLCSSSWLIESYLLFLTFSALDVNFSFSQSILIRTLMGIGGVISLLPGGLITTDSTSIALSIAYGAGRLEAFAATLFIRIYTLFLPSLIGLIAIILQKDLNSTQQNS